MHLVEVGGLQDIGRFDHPLAAAGGNEDTEHSRINGDQQGIGVVGADGGQKPGERVGDPSSHNHSEDHGIERELDEHPSGGGDALRNGAHESFRTPVQ